MYQAQLISTKKIAQIDDRFAKKDKFWFKIFLIFSWYTNGAAGLLAQHWGGQFLTDRLSKTQIRVQARGAFADKFFSVV